MEEKDDAREYIIRYVLIRLLAGMQLARGEEVFVVVNVVVECGST